MARVSLTRNRFRIARDMAVKQHSMAAAARAINMKVKTYRIRLGSLHKMWRQEGLDEMMASNYSDVALVDDPAKRIKSRIDILNYATVAPREDEDEIVATFSWRHRKALEAIEDELDG